MNQYNKEKDRDIRISKCEYEMLKQKAKALVIIRKMPLSFRIKIIEQANDLDGSVDLLKEVLL